MANYFCYIFDMTFGIYDAFFLLFSLLRVTIGFFNWQEMITTDFFNILFFVAYLYSWLGATLNIAFIDYNSYFMTRICFKAQV